MNKINMTKSLLGVSLMCFIAFSCNKAVDLTDDQMIAQDNAIVEQSSEDVNNISNQEETTNGLTGFKTEDANSLLSGDVKIEKDKVNNKTVIDFGEGYVSKNGKSFTGKMVKTTNGKKYFEDGYIANITYEKFKSNGNAVSGTKTIEYKGLDANGNRYWLINTNHTVTKTNGKTVTFTATKTRTQIAGAETQDIISDDKYSITGSGSGTASNGMTFEFKITNPLIRDMSCKFLTAGTIEYLKTGKITRTRTLDYGNGTCDAIATVTVDGQTKEITLD